MITFFFQRSEPDEGDGSSLRNVTC